MTTTSTTTTTPPRFISEVNKSWRVLIPPAVEPITLEDAYMHLRLTTSGSPPSHPEDRWLTMFGIPSARLHCENWLERSLALQTIELSLSRFPGSDPNDLTNYIELPMGPVAGLDTFSYVADAGGELVSPPLDGFGISGTDPAVLYADTWPTVKAGVPGAVRVRYVAGYSPANSSPLLTPELPAVIKIAMLLMLGHLYEYREATTAGDIGSTLPHELPLGVAALLEPYRYRK